MKFKIGKVSSYSTDFLCPFCNVIGINGLFNNILQDIRAWEIADLSTCACVHKVL
jgi:hypothetical protein